MTKQKSLTLNMVMNVILTMSSLIFPLITFPYVSRVVGAEGIGKVTFATSVITYFSMFAQLGIPTYGIRACAKVRDNKERLSKTVHEILIINTITCVISYIALGIALTIVPKFASDKMLFLIIASTILLNALGVEWLFKALEQYTYITIRSIVFKFIALIAMFLLVHTKTDYVIYGGITILAASASNVLNFLYLPKLIHIKPIGNYHLSQHMKMIFVFFALSVATTIYTNLDNVMLGFMTNDIEVGYYTASVKVKGILVSVVTAVSTVLLPRASYYVDKGLIKELYGIAQKAMSFVMLVAIPFVVYFTIYAEECIVLLSGEEFTGAIMPMQVIMPTLLFIGITNILGIQIMVPLGKENQVLYSTICGAIADLILNAIFIPQYGAIGAAIGTLVAEFVVLVYQVIVMKSVIKQVFGGVKYIVVIISVILATICCIWVKQLQIGIFLTLLISAIIFFGVYLVGLLLGKEKAVIDIFKMVLDKVKKKKA